MSGKLCSRMWSGFSSEIETPFYLLVRPRWRSRMWSGFSSEIETTCPARRGHTLLWVACGAASRLRLKLSCSARGSCYRKVACGAASRLRLKLVYHLLDALCQGMSHVERLLV